MSKELADTKAQILFSFDHSRSSKYRSNTGCAGAQDVPHDMNQAGELVACTKRLQYVLPVVDMPIFGF
jgi:hypothetical protein